MDREELQERRAYNQIWNGAGRYDLQPRQAVFDGEGEAELYWNTVMGLAYGCYDFSHFQPMLHRFEQQPEGALYTDIFWLGLEHAVFARSTEQRPALEPLRLAYLRRVAAQPCGGDPRKGGAALRAVWAKNILGQTPEDPQLRELLATLAFSPAWTEQEIVKRTEELLFRFFRRARRSVTDRQWAAFAGRSIVGKGGGIRLLRPNALRALGRSGSAEGGGGGGKTLRLLGFLQGKTPEPILRRYVEDCFGASMLTPVRLAEAERELCTGVHRNCRLHFTRGDPPKRPISGDAAWDAESFRRQREKNRAYYQANLARNRLTIAQLTQKLQNALLLRQDEEELSGRTGRLRGEAAWRAAALGEERIFTRRSDSRLGDLSVDILLDGSASQNRQQEKLATQAYILVESLTRCAIPVRVMAFCSVSGCTVLRVLREYDKPEENERVFDYVSAGWNRDGLALRAAAWLMRRAQSQNRLLLILSDASPNDDQRIPIGALPLGGYSYSGKRGVDDTAAEAGQLRRQGIRPVCIFTGSDDELPAARKIYGQAMERIPSVGWFADAVSRLLCRQLRQI